MWTFPLIHPTMATEMQIQIIESQIVKPSSPTPDNCRSYKLSVLDQLSVPDSLPLLLFYPGTTRLMSVSETSQLLVKSLSQTLTSFYHFAGRLRDNIAIECNDYGAEFVAVRVNCPLSELLTNPDFDVLAKLVPRQTFLEEELFESPLLQVKVNFFDCGGLAIGVCVSHKVGDASTLNTFVNCWAQTTLKSELDVASVPPLVSLASIFPPLESHVSSEGPHQLLSDETVKRKRLVFHGPEIEALRSKISTVQNLTRVEAVSALIWKCVFEALSVSRGSESGGRDSYFAHALNLRKRMNPCWPENSVGNLVWFFEAKIPKDSRAELENLAVLLREGIDEAEAIWKGGTPSEALSGATRERDSDDIVHFVATSWCRLPLYGADFGWGKPVWICTPKTASAKNMCVMMDTRDGKGIEVTLLLVEEEMKHFQTNPELLAFASLDPAVVI